MNARIAVVAVLLAAAACAQAPAQAPAARPLTARIRLDKLKESPVVLLRGREPDGRLICQTVEPPQTTMRVKPADVSSIRFRIQYDEETFASLRRAGRWTEAAMVLGTACVPTLPYLDAAPNNGVGLAMRMAQCLLRGGDIRTGFAPDPAARKAGEAEFRHALLVFEKIAAAEWSERAPEARLRASACLVFLGRLEEAAAILEEVGEPEVDADEYGAFQLALAYLAAARGEWEEALEAAVHCSDFASKDIDSFPSALLLAAQCYEKLGQPHRARDVYYELGRLFGQTPWGENACRSLRRILDSGETAGDEKASAQDLFFAADDDVNAEARKLLGIDENGNPIPKPEPADKK